METHSNKKNVSKKEPIYTDNYHYEGSLDVAVDTARHYGFFLIEQIKDLQKLSSSNFHLTPSEKKTVFKTFVNSEKIKNSKRKHVKPIMICHTKTLQNKKNESEFHLNIFNEKKSIGEATVIKTLFSILNEYGYKNTIVIINSLGDKSSRNNFLRDLKLYYKKRLNSVCSNCRNKFEKDIFKILECESKKCSEIRENAPKSISYLTEQDRNHFKEIIEYLESTNTNYLIDYTLVGNSNCVSHTIFQVCEIVSDGDISSRRVLVKGERYFDFTQGNKFKKIPSIHASLKISNKDVKLCKPKWSIHTKNEKIIKIATIPKKRIPKIYFAQLGFDARLASLEIIENLRKNNIIVCQSMAEKGITTQMSEAKFLKTPFVMIMGTKEVKEGEVIVRKMENYQQDSISLENLVSYIKKVVK